MVRFGLLRIRDTLSNFIQRLTETQLPSRGRCRILVKEYFDNIHPLRSFSFIHRPSFVQRLDEGLLVNGPGHILLHVVCALGAK